MHTDLLFLSSSLFQGVELRVAWIVCGMGRHQLQGAPLPKPVPDWVTLLVAVAAAPLMPAFASLAE